MGLFDFFKKKDNVAPAAPTDQANQPQSAPQEGFGASAAPESGDQGMGSTPPPATDGTPTPTEGAPSTDGAPAGGDQNQMPPTV